MEETPLAVMLKVAQDLELQALTVPIHLQKSSSEERKLEQGAHGLAVSSRVNCPK